MSEWLLLVLTTVAVCGSLLWLCAPIFVHLLLKHAPDLIDHPPQEPLDWPKLSVIIAACNEEETISAALETLLQQSYPNLEIVVVNDRSTDRTGEIIRDWAQRDPRIVDIHLTDLPEDWLGKVHAMHHATRHATGEWLLFTDADVHFFRDVLRRVVSLGQQLKLDHLALVPLITSDSFFAQCAISTALRGIIVTQKVWRISDPNTEEAFGAGAFNLVRKAHFENTPGFEWLKMEVADDIGLAQMLKAAGGRTHMVRAPQFVSVEWYPSVRSLVRGLEKNAYAQLANFSFLRGLSFSVVLMIVPMSPLFLLFVSGRDEIVALGVIALLGATWSSILLRAVINVPWYKTLASFVVGEMLLSWVVLRSTILGALRGGVIWRGTVYPNAKLRLGRRVDF